MTPFCQSKTEFYNASLQLTAVQLFFCLPKTRQNLAPKSGKSSSFNLHIFKQQTFQQPLVAKTSLTKKFATFSPLSFNFLNLPVDGSGCFKTADFGTPCWTCDLKRRTNKICFSRDSNDFQYLRLGFIKPEIFKTWILSFQCSINTFKDPTYSINHDLLSTFVFHFYLLTSITNTAGFIIWHQPKLHAPFSNANPLNKYHTFLASTSISPAKNGSLPVRYKWGV